MLTAIDTETFLITETNLVPRLVCVSFGNGRVLHARQDRDELQHALSCMLDGDDPIVGHHIAYDLAVIREEFPWTAREIEFAYQMKRVRDTGVTEMLLTKSDKWPSLASLAEKYKLRTLDKSSDGWRLRYSELIFRDIGEWPWEAISYAMCDAVTTREIFHLQQKTGLAWSAEREVELEWEKHNAEIQRRRQCLTA